MKAYFEGSVIHRLARGPHHLPLHRDVGPLEVGVLLQPGDDDVVGGRGGCQEGRGQQGPEQTQVRSLRSHGWRDRDVSTLNSSLKRW